MKVFQLLEAVVRSAEDLSNAFTDQEWANIATHYYKKRLGDISVLQFNGLFFSFQRKLGRFMPKNTSPEMWAAISIQHYVDDVPTTRSWQQIYNILKRHASTEGFDYTDADPTRQAGDLSDRTEESKSEVAAWVPTQKTEWTSYEDFKKEYLLPWLTVMKSKREGQKDSSGMNYWTWLTSFGYQQSNGQYSVPRRNALMELYKHFKRQTTITKADADNQLWVWLKGNDFSWSQRINDK